MRVMVWKGALVGLVVSAGLLMPAAAAGPEDSNASFAPPESYLEPGGDDGVSFADAVPGVAPDAEAGAEEAPRLAVAGPEDPNPGFAPPEFYVEPGGDERVSFADAVPGIAPDTAPGVEGAVLLPACTPQSHKDNPHRSSTGFAVSGHGSWDKGTCNNNRAIVYNCLYEWYTDGTWRRKACSNKRELRPKAAGGGRTTARRDCDNSQVTSWRNHVDVDVIDEGDTAEWPYRQNNVQCRYFGPDS